VAPFGPAPPPPQKRPSLPTCARRLASAGGSTLAAFLWGAAGVFLGALLGWQLLKGQLGAEGPKLAAALCASYIGGSVNFAAVAKVSAAASQLASQLARAPASASEAVCSRLALLMGQRRDVPLRPCAPARHPQATGLSAAAIPGALAADNLAMAAYLAAVMAVPVARQRGRQQEEAAADKGAAAPGGGGAAHGLHRQQQQQEEALAGSSAGRPRAAVEVAVAAAEPVLAAVQTDDMQQPTILFAALEAAPGLRPTASAAQQLQSSDISSGGADSASAGSGPTAESLALSVAAGSLACTLGSLGAAALGNASLALMLMALVAAALGSAASIASPGRKLFAGGAWPAPPRCACRAPRRTHGHARSTGLLSTAGSSPSRQARP
jgi:hypothetical protein